MRPELLSPAGSPESLRAAVQNGAGAVYLGWGEFNARRGAKNFTDEDFAQALRYCHERGVRVFLTLNTLVTDRELPAALETARQACRLGWTVCWCRTGASLTCCAGRCRTSPFTPAPR